MEDVHKKTQPGGILAGFKCSFYVVCLDVSQQLDHMVCECTKGMLQLWSHFIGRLVWTRPVKSYNMDSLLPSLGFNARWLNSCLKKEKDDRIMESIVVRCSPLRNSCLSFRQ